MLGSVRRGGRPARRRDPGAFGAYVVTSQPDALYARARAAGAEITAEPYDTDYGSGISRPVTRRGTAGRSAPTGASPARPDAPRGGLTGPGRPGRRSGSNVPGMRAWHVEAPGPVTGHPLRLSTADDVPEPGPGELLLRVLACGVCRTDLHVIEGDLPPQRPGVTPGHQVVGDIRALGDTAPAGFGNRVGGAGAAWLRWTGQSARSASGGREPVPTLTLHRLGRRRGLCRVPDGPGGVRAPAAGGLLRRRTGPAAMRRHHRLPRPAAGRTAARTAALGIYGFGTSGRTSPRRSRSARAPACT